MKHLQATLFRSTSVIALLLLAAVDALASEPPSEADAATAECLAWIENTYRIDSITRELGLELSADYEPIRACVDHDTHRMSPANAVKFCDNVFKVHCSGVDLLAVIGEAVAERCEERLGESLGLRLRQYEGWRTCAQHKVIDRYSKKGEASDEAQCKAAFLDECGTNVDAALETDELTSEQRAFVECCSAEALGAESRGDSGACGMIDDGFERGPCHDRPVCVHRFTSEWIHCPGLE